MSYVPPGVCQICKAPSPNHCGWCDGATIGANADADLAAALARAERAERERDEAKDRLMTKSGLELMVAGHVGACEDRQAEIEARVAEVGRAATEAVAVNERLRTELARVEAEEMNTRRALHSAANDLDHARASLRDLAAAVREERAARSDWEKAGSGVDDDAFCAATEHLNACLRAAEEEGRSG